MSISAINRIILSFAITWLLCASTNAALAQNQDSTGVATDSLDVATLDVDSTATVIPSSTATIDSTINHLVADFKRSDFEIPFTHTGIEFEDALRSAPGSFLQDLTTPGWPSAWTIRNRPLNSIALEWDGLNFDELFTGRPAFEMLPRGLITSTVEAVGTQSNSIVKSQTRAMVEDRYGPALTELSYRTGNRGLQYVYASHSQAQVRKIFGQSVRIQLTAGYSGQKADGEFPGSKLERMRNVIGKIRLSGASNDRFSFELSDMANRRTLGAHGGVIRPVPSDPSSIYRRFGAIVRDGSAERRTKRNDLTATLSFRGDKTWIDWTSRKSSQFFRFRNTSDTLSVDATRYATQIRVRKPIRNALLGLRTIASTENIRQEDLISFTGSRALARYSTLGDISLPIFGFGSGDLSAGVNYTNDQLSYESSAQFTTEIDHLLKLKVSASRSVPIPDLITRTGFDKFATVSSDTNLGYVTDAHVRIGTNFFSFSAAATGFAVLSENHRDWFATTNADSIAYRSIGVDIRTLGTTIEIGFRVNNQRGFYFRSEATAISTSAIGSLESGTVFPGDVGPKQYATVTTGLKYLLFKNDLDGDFGLRARFWPDFTGRVFHRQTGLMAVPTSVAETVDASVALDLVVEAGIRGATVYLTYENLLSGTDIVVGNQLVSGYPLAQRRLRFGVYWPISN